MQGLGNGVEGERPVHRGFFVTFVLSPSRAWFRIACSGFIFFIASSETNISRPDPLYYSYNELIKAGIALPSYYQVRVRSVPGHHVKILAGC